jgi:hypothetical protein
MKQTDQENAVYLMEMKKNGATFRWAYFLKSKLLWGAVIVVGSMLAFTIAEPSLDMSMQRVIWLLAGVLLGRILRDMVWLKQSRDSFAFLAKVLDWGKVETLAQPEGTAPATPSTK